MSVQFVLMLVSRESLSYASYAFPYSAMIDVNDRFIGHRLVLAVSCSPYGIRRNGAFCSMTPCALAGFMCGFKLFLCQA